MSDISTKSQELAKSLWAIANDLRGSMDSSKFATSRSEQRIIWTRF